MSPQATSPRRTCLALALLFAAASPLRADVQGPGGSGYIPLPEDLRQGLEGQGQLDRGTELWNRAQDADPATLRSYAERVDSALAGDLGQKLDESGYSEQALGLWARIKALLFGED